MSNIDINDKANKAIIYQQRNGSIGVLIPTQEGIDLFDLHYLAEKDVPAGCPFKIVDKSELPSLEDTVIESWTVDVADLNDGVGGDFHNL